MHELSIVEALIEHVQDELRKQSACAVTRISLVIGRLSGVNPDSIRFAFELLSRDTPLEKAEVAIAQPPAVCACRACGARTEIDELTAQCPKCTSSDIAIEGGQELLLDSIEIDEPQ